MQLVGLSGLAGSGKDTVGEILRDDHGFMITSFAHPIKKMICESLLGVSVDKWNDRLWRETPIPVIGCSPRRLAQTLGTEWGREQIKNSLWLDLALEKIKVTAWDRFAITDLRFDNEADRIRRLGGHVVHVRREDRDVCHAGHASEKGVTPFHLDWLIRNDGTLDELREQVNTFIEWLERKEAI